MAASTADAWPGSLEDMERDYRHIQYSDVAVLASRQPRADFPCQVTSNKPSLGFDLRFHADYRATVPLKALADAGGWLQVVMRVTPAAESERPVYFIHRMAIPDEALRANRDATLAGRFYLGLGRYRLDWMMRDARQRICSSHWDLEAKPDHGHGDLPLTLGPNQIAGSAKDASADSLQATPEPAMPLRVKILLNLSPGKPEASIVKPEDAKVLFSMLSSITGQPEIARFTLVAFNLREQKILYRQENADQVDFDALGKAIHSPTAGTIDYSLLRDPRSETRFATRLLTDQLGAQPDPPDAIIIVGPVVSLDRDVPLAPLRMKGAAMCPVFYLNYNPKPFDEPWPDTIGSALKAYKGASAYSIALPGDLGLAMRRLLSRIVKRPASAGSF
jgi:hypothetical protein